MGAINMEGKQPKENEIIFEQPLLALRVVHTTEDMYDIEVAMYDGNSVGTEIKDEWEAKTIVNGLLAAYKKGLFDLQAEMLEALTHLSDEAHTEGNKSVGP